MRVIVEARFGGNNVTVAMDAEHRYLTRITEEEKRQCVIDATNALLRSLNLPEIVGEIAVVK